MPPISQFSAEAVALMAALPVYAKVKAWIKKDKEK